ncbi:DNA replication factor Cdt1 isoform X2 [Wyeomyia smithii]|uniref:DNA replication factor Cdt1 isoform X2 n=1 Tax=Wyeomyia smithii TaxID=174621 RepID=UPI00246801EA|nr:DNA replication factor Cdt1 isoform X2 [Wyeomyia smithii]
MSQPTVAAYFNARKRAAADGLGSATRNKNVAAAAEKESAGDALESRRITRATRTIRRIGAVTVNEKTREMLEQPKLVNFLKKGNLSPRKKTVHKEQSPAKGIVLSEQASMSKEEFSIKNNASNIEKKMTTPTKQGLINQAQLGKPAIANLSMEEIKSNLSRSDRLAQLKTSLSKMRSGFDKLDSMRNKQIEASNKKPTVPPSPTTAARNLKQFQTLEVEVPISPQKMFTSPTKTLHRTPTKAHHSSLMSPTKNVTPKRLSALMSPIKEPSPTPVAASPTKVPAYQLFQHLTEFGRPKLQLPYKYRCLAELFNRIDTVCAMFYNRKEQITFKKLKPAVQRMARKNLYESHLAQIKTLFPDAFNLSLELTKNYGSVTKHETYQLVIKPNIKEKPCTTNKNDEDANVIRNAQNQSMNPQAITERSQKFSRLLLSKVMDAHQKFLLSLDPPMHIAREKLTCWHPQFDLESCPDIEQAALPQPPNVERFSSAKDVLSAARNLFNCSTTMERALQRVEEKKRQNAVEQSSQLTNKTNIAPPVSTAETKSKPEHIYHDGLKNVPKSLLEKIRAKQAAKALDQMTRRPSIEQQAIKYGRLPELARHLRNVFVTERKSVLPMETALIKIENSYRGRLTLKELEEHLRMISQLAPFWLTLTEVRKTMYAKIVKDCDMTKVIEPLEKKANDLLKG